MFMGIQAKVQVWKSEEILEEEFLSFPHVHPEAATQTPDLAAKAFSRAPLCQHLLL